MWTKEQITNFVASHPINTGGAATLYSFETADREDGDEWQEVSLPVWTQNRQVALGVFNFTLDALKFGGFATNVCVRDNLVIVSFFTHFCDPD